MPYKDKEKHAAYMRKWYSERKYAKEHHLELVAKNNTRYAEQRQALLAEFRKNGCMVCGEMDEACLDAHHRNPAEKSFNISNHGKRGYSVATYQEELAKCVCLCSNCHRKLHAGRITL